MSGDTIAVNHIAYLLLNPKRGDIVQFLKEDSGQDEMYLRRVIALPGETVQIIDGMIYIDGKTLLEQKPFPSITNPGMAAEPVKLSATEYFVLGDNRNNSEDSRFADVGNIKRNRIIGKVWFVGEPLDRMGFVR